MWPGAISDPVCIQAFSKMVRNDYSHGSLVPETGSTWVSQGMPSLFNLVVELVPNPFHLFLRDVQKCLPGPFGQPWERRRENDPKTVGQIPRSFPRHHSGEVVLSSRQREIPAHLVATLCFGERFGVRFGVRFGARFTLCGFSRHRRTLDTPRHA